ncbi:eukaryotic translation initiation factor 3 subunit G-like [Tubulanus polymorphus]|uniref:eukaryotic translation initiation factor 3 subunit G-like n=1 Tax=Tubulanus polymorphus TaxID=672921 RepID=UPI003DA42D61
MPSIDTETIGKSWADEVEQVQSGDLPEPSEDFDEATNTRTITEYKLNEDGKRVRIVKTYKIETRKVSTSIAKRKQWKKFGAATHDPPGPNPANTVIAEDVFMAFVSNKEVSSEAEEDPLAKMKGQKIVSCRICKGDHWTTKCPYKDTLSPLADALGEGGAATEPKDGAASTATTPATPAAAATAASKTGKYVPPSLRGGAGAAKGRGETMQSKRDESATIRVTNLPEETRELDLQELFRPFGMISRIYLAKDKHTNTSKGFAFVNFHKREDAARAIVGVSGYGYDHLILNVEWAKPSGNTM